MKNATTITMVIALLAFSHFAAAYTHIGTDKQDTIIGTPGNDKMKGKRGADKIYGKQGADHIEGNRGDDTLVGDDGNDRIWGGDDRDTIFGNAGNDYLRGGENPDNIFGGDGNDDIYGGDGDDYINGGCGDDRLRGGDGTDAIVDDCGNNTYRMRGSATTSIESGDGDDTYIVSRKLRGLLIIEDAGGDNTLIFEDISKEEFNESYIRTHDTVSQAWSSKVTGNRVLVIKRQQLSPNGHTRTDGFTFIYSDGM